LISRVPPRAMEGIIVDFIEKILGFAPDNGSGAFEFLLFLIPVIGIFAIREWRRRDQRK
jgi:hypothetical protein